MGTTSFICKRCETKKKNLKTFKRQSNATQIQCWQVLTENTKFLWHEPDRRHKTVLSHCQCPPLNRKIEKENLWQIWSSVACNFEWLTVKSGRMCTKRDRRAGLNQRGPVSLWKCLRFHKRSMTCFVSIGSKYGVRWETVQLKYETVTRITLATSAKRS